MGMDVQSRISWISDISMRSLYSEGEVIEFSCSKCTNTYKNGDLRVEKARYCPACGGVLLEKRGRKYQKGFENTIKEIGIEDIDDTIDNPYNMITASKIGFLPKGSIINVCDDINHDDLYLGIIVMETRSYGGSYQSLYKEDLENKLEELQKFLGSIRVNTQDIQLYLSTVIV